MKWYYKTCGASQGPLDREELVKLLRSGVLMPQVEVSEDGANWVIAAQVPGLMAELFSPQTPINHAAPPANPPAPQPPASNANTSIGIADLPGAASPAVPLPVTGEIATGDAADTNTSSEATPPAGAAGHLTFNPAAREQANAKVRESRGGSLKLAIIGGGVLVGLTAIGLFTASRVFGFDLLPARTDRSVSRFMVEHPVLIAHIDPDSILESRAVSALSQSEVGSAGQALTYLSDAEDIVVAADRIDSLGPNFVAIVTLKRDYRKEFVANLMRGATTEAVGEFQVHVDPRSLGGTGLALCLPEPRTLLAGSPYAVKRVLERNGHPKLYPRESRLIANTTSGGKTASVGMFVDFLGDTISEAEEKFAAQTKRFEALNTPDKSRLKQLLGDFEKILDNTKYIVKHTEHVMLEIDLTDQLAARAQVECGSKRSAKKVAEKLAWLLDNRQMLAGKSAGQPVANGTKVETTYHFNLSEITSALPRGLAQGGVRPPK